MIGWWALGSAAMIILSLWIITLTFDSGPGWLHWLCLLLFWLAALALCVALIALVVDSINSSLPT